MRVRRFTEAQIAARYRARHPQRYKARLARAKIERITNAAHISAQRLARRYPGIVPTRPMPDHCEACGAKRLGRLVLDHCHIADVFRGWLCKRCNLALGLLDDTTAKVRGLLNYLWRIEHMKYTIEQLQAMIDDAEAFRVTLRNRQDDSAHYWRVFLAERIYQLRVDLCRAREACRKSA